ncbi:MAG: VTT domain-containing protein [bacterium]|nr:VTT domain-containing protein [bacterium]
METHSQTKLVARDIWLLVIIAAFYLYFFQRGFIVEQITRVVDAPLYVRYWVYLVLGCLRGFTLIPVTYLIILGLLFLPLKPLFILTLVGIMVSSIVVYYFSEFLHLSEFFERKYPTQIAKLKSVIEKNELPIVILWSMLPFTPTDVICYVCGSLKIDKKKFLLGVFIGEGITCAVYIFLGKEILLFLLRVV